MHRRNLLLGAFAALSVASCGTWGIDYNNSAVSRAQQWHVAQLNIVASPSLSVSMADTLDPNADIVWWSNLPADPAQRLATRRPEVRRILAENVAKVTGQLNGPTAVRMDVSLIRFHGITPTAYRTLEISGVHNVAFDVKVYDLATGAQLAESVIHADTPALADAERRRQNAAGNTDTVRVGATIRRAMSGWLGLTGDTRQTFSRIGS